MELFNIFRHYTEQNYLENWSRKGFYENNGQLIHCKLLNVCKDIKFLEDIDNFSNVHLFTKYIQDKLVEYGITENALTSQFKGYIFELFTECFLNYFSNIAILNANKNEINLYTIKYVCLPPESYKDYGIDQLCRITANDGISKNAVIQVKFRTSDEFNLSTTIIDKLGFQGSRAGFINPITPENNKDKTLILFTNLYYNEYKRAFENNIGFENLLIIDGTSIDYNIKNNDFWQFFKNLLQNIIQYA
ncbi:MAG: hypothetical protein [Wendovervirus sonii]|uniref:Restriction endonuclease type IV Mrr domain-containing protein n=1 Tax=phage Lak_Megaphage_Sonny TaxID=3109229 RepID=A0ABZ0Z225_9CAUD|nr:MAG: hypothetical protein [phage Lak_Megaphage_Sonny]